MTSHRSVWANDKAIAENCLSFIHPARILAVVRILYYTILYYTMCAIIYFFREAVVVGKVLF